MHSVVNQEVTQNVDAYCFDRFRLDLRRGVLQTGDGADIPLRPRSYDLLRYMVERPKYLLRRNDLLEALWQGLAVTDDNLTQCISDLRRAFGERGVALLRTVPRRGYILTTDVRRVTARPSPLRPPSAVQATATDAAPSRDALILAPIELATEEADATFLARALGAEFLAAFTHSEVARVLVRPTTPPPDAFRLAGMLLRGGDTPLLSLVLDEILTGRVIWADQLSLPAAGERRRTLTLLVATVEIQMSGQALQRARRRSPHELGPHDLVMLGRELHQRGGEANTREAQLLFSRAIDIAPDLAVAHGYLTLTELRFITHGWAGQDGPEQRRHALGTARHAVELAPRSPLCLAALAFALLQSRLWDEAVTTARNALSLSSISAMDTRTVCAEVLAAVGESEDAAAALSESIVLNPFSPPRARAVLGRALLMAGRIEEALAELHRAAALLPDYAPCLRSIVVAATELGRMDEARDAFVHLRRMQPNWIAASPRQLSFFRHERDAARFRAAFALCESGDRCTA